MSTFRHAEDLAWAQILLDKGTVREAAAGLGVCHSTVSRRIRQLESRIGRPLFQRRGRVLTPYPYTLDLLGGLAKEPPLPTGPQTPPNPVPVDQMLFDWFPLLADRIRNQSEFRAARAICPEPAHSAWVRQLGSDMTAMKGWSVTVLGRIMWGVLALPTLRYDVKRVPLYTSRGAAAVPASWALIQPESIIQLERMTDVIKAVNAHQGLGWMPLNTGLWYADLVEASTEDERVVDSLMLESHPALTQHPDTKPWANELSATLSALLAQSSSQGL